MTAVGKPNSYLLQQQKKISAAKAETRKLTLLLSEDMVRIAAYEVLGASPEVQEKMVERFRAGHKDWSTEVVKDDDKDFWYSLEVHERNMREVMGDTYRPWRDRHVLH